MGHSFSFGWEDKLIIFIQKFMSDFPVKLAGLITEFGDALVLVAIVGLFYWSLNKEFGKKLVLYMSFVNIVNPCIKSSVMRRRPYMSNPDVKCLKPVNSEGDIMDVVTQEFSFPSGHAANSMSIYGTLFKNYKNTAIRIITAALIVLVGISRFALGVHYPTDILAGWLVAIICITVCNLLERYIGRYKMYILLDVIGIAGFFIAKTNDFYTGYGLLLGSTLAIIFEEKIVRFEGTKKVLPVILRTLIGAGLFLGLNELMKLPFSESFLNSGTTLAFTVRAIRYTVTSFVLIGLYPMCFRLFKYERKN